MRSHALVMAIHVALVAGAPLRCAASDAPIVYTRAQIGQSGFRTVADFLQRLPPFGSTLNPRYNGGGNGEHRVDLRDLGAQRTLVLLDGRRIAHTLDGAADLSRIPLAIVERIEISLGGDGARRGSAIAGTIDIVTRRGEGGMQAQAWYGRSDEGDGVDEAYDVTLGASNERGDVLLNVSYASTHAILAGDRERSRVPLFGFSGNNVNVGSASTTPFGRFGRPGVPGTVTLIPGRPGTTPGDFAPFNPATDGFNFAPENYLLAPSERNALFASTRYAVSEDITFHATTLVGERRSAQRLAPLPWTFGFAFGNTITIPASNLYNPFGVQVTRAQYRNTIVPRRFRQDVDTLRFDAGFDGAFDALDRRFAWQLGYVYEDIEERAVATGQFDFNRLRQGLGASFIDPQTGVPTCGTPSSPIAGCVPIDIFTGPDAFTPEMADFAGVTLQDTRRVQLDGFNAQLSLDLFALPAGALSAAAGYRGWREAGFDQPDALAQSGGTGLPSRVGTRGAMASDEWRLAFEVPILDDVPGAQRLALSIGASAVEIDPSGQVEPAPYGGPEPSAPRSARRDRSATAHSLRLDWQPFDAWHARAGIAQALRTPSIAELFAGQENVFPTAFDPCMLSSDPQGVVYERCRDGFGGIAPFPYGGYEIGFQLRATRGGNPYLVPERSDNAFAGLSFRPPGIEGLDVSLDWYRVRVTDAIGTEPASALLNDCYVNANLAACASVTRAPDGYVQDVFVGYRNGARGIELEAYDLLARYRFERAGHWISLTAMTSYTAYIGDPGQRQRGTCKDSVDYLTSRGSCATAPASGNLAGTYRGRGNAFNRIRARFTAEWQHGNWGASAVARYLSALDEDCALPVRFGRPGLCSDPEGSPQFRDGENRLAATWTFDLQARWDAPWNAQLSAGVRNLFDEDAPLAYSAFDSTTDPQYELPGRFFYLGYEQRF